MDPMLEEQLCHQHWSGYNLTWFCHGEAVLLPSDLLHLHEGESNCCINQKNFRNKPWELRTWFLEVRERLIIWKWIVNSILYSQIFFQWCMEIIETTNENIRACTMYNENIRAWHVHLTTSNHRFKTSNWKVSLYYLYTSHWMIHSLTK